jgi:hypothetical protein
MCAAHGLLACFAVAPRGVTTGGGGQNKLGQLLMARRAELAALHAAAFAGGAAGGVAAAAQPEAYPHHLGGKRSRSDGVAGADAAPAPKRTSALTKARAAAKTAPPAATPQEVIDLTQE